MCESLDYDPCALYANMLGISFDSMRNMNDDVFDREVDRRRSSYHAGDGMK